MNYVVLDRDGTLIRHIPYLSKPGQVEVLPTVVAGLTRLVQSGRKIFLHTNQSGIGRRYFTMQDVEACNDEMLRQIGLGNELFERICVSPEAPDQEIEYRKPSPKYGHELIAHYGILQSDICYVGDNVTDLLTAKNIGCIGIGVNTGMNDLRLLLKEHGLENEFPVFDTFAEAVDFIIDYEMQLNEVVSR